MRARTALKRVPATPKPDAAATANAAMLQGLGLRVRGLRERRGMPRRTLAHAAGVSERYLAQLESGEGNSSILLLQRVASALNVSLTELWESEQTSVSQRLVRRLLERLPEQKLEETIFRLLRDYGAGDAGRRRRVALVGLRGAGKSTLGPTLAQTLKAPFLELDRDIAREAGMQLSEIFSLYGQTGYRRIERRCLEKAIEQHPAAVIAVGGGIVSEPGSYELLLANFFTVWLKAEPEEHMARVVAQGDSRPMEGHAEAMDDLRRILAAREPLYAKADIVLNTSAETPQQSLSRLRQALRD